MNINSRSKLESALSLILACFLASGPGSPLAAQTIAPATISCQELRRMQLAREDFLLVDVRSPAEFGQAHIQGAKNIPAGRVGSAGLPKEAVIILYCPDESCPLSRMAADKLAGLGYSAIQVLQGGLAEWSGKGYPVEPPRTAQTKMPRPVRASAAQTREKIKAGAVLLLDVRPALEFAAGRLPGARNAPLEELEVALLGFSKDKEVLVYDRLGSRSAEAARRLLDAGFKVTELTGGLAAWVKKKYPLEIK